ncbi:uncharacterized protein FFNC_04127 [Fusarium fujikuroi]|nr:uncharacterized protein FFNC_04127 [Fusarium fujikuroi]
MQLPLINLIVLCKGYKLN